MPTNIDELQIEINAKAQDANTAIDRLVGKLDRLSASLGRLNTSNLNTLAMGVNRLGTAMQTMNGVKTADFTRLAKNLERLNLIDVSNLSSISASVNHMATAFNQLGNVSENALSIGEMAKNIAKLGNKSVQTAITNIPQLAVAMRDLLTTLSTAPNVSRNIIDMTNALANLANQGSRVGSASRSIVRGMNNTTSSMNRARKSTTSLAAAFGKFYATWFLAIRGAKGLVNAIESTTDYLEAFNFYDTAFTKVGNESADEFEKYGKELGYATADEYADSFESRMNENLRKLSGLKLEQFGEGRGLLTESGMKNLGLNIQEVTTYAAQLASVMNSIGQTSEVTLAASKAFTNLAGDISSLFNIDYSSAANNIQSVLMGQSRAGYKFGWDTTVATLQKYADEFDLSKPVSEMSQVEKQQLRMIAILDQSRVSWGNLADTIESPANMMRLFKNNLAETGMVLGQLFAPLLQKVLPLINGVTIAIKNLLVSIASLLGIELRIDEAPQLANDAAEGFDDMADSLDGVASSAKKAKAGLRAFDELKVINMPETSGGSGGVGGGAIDLTDEILKATSEYEKVWQEAYDRMANKAQEIADRISKTLEPVRKIFEDFAVGDFFQAGEDTSHLVASILDFFAKAIDKVNWYGIGEDIGDFFEGIDWILVFSSLGNLIWQGLKAALEVAVGFLSDNPIEKITTIVSLIEISKIGKILLGKGALKAVSSGISSLIKNIPVVISGIKILSSGGLLQEGGFISKLANAIALTAGGAGTLHESLVATFGAVGTALAGIGSVISGLLLAVDEFFSMWDNGWSVSGEILKDVGIALTALGTIILGVAAAPAAIAAAVVAAVSTIAIVVHDNWDAISDFFSELWSNIQSVWGQASEWFNQNVIQPIANFFSGFSSRVQQIFEGLWIIVQAIWKIASEWFSTNVIIPLVNIFAPIAEKVSGFFEVAWTLTKAIWGKVSDWFNTKIINPVVSAFMMACDKIGGFFSELWSGIKKGVVGAMNVVIGGIESGINFMISGINAIISGFNRVVSWAASIIEADWDGVELVPKVTIPRIQGYEIGGFPKPYSLFAAGEGGRAEILGTVGGQTAVAGGAEITGIRDAVLASHQEEMELMRQQNELLRGILAKEFGITEQQIGKAAANYSKDYMRRTGNPAFAF